jgi:hypothetical protein
MLSLDEMTTNSRIARAASFSVIKILAFIFLASIAMLLSSITHS